MKPRFSRALALGAGLLALLLTGCATATKPAAMTAAAPVGIQNKHTAGVSVHVSGGRSTNPAWTSQISDEDFASAIRESIAQSGLFSSVVGAEASGYHLEVMLVRVAQPIAGFNMTVTVEVNWKLIRQSDRAIVWQRAVESSHTATTGDAFVGTTRLRMATEGAARANIEKALVEISKVPLE